MQSKGTPGNAKKWEAGVMDACKDGRLVYSIEQADTRILTDHEEGMKSEDRL
jgi:hypothetical protein